MEISPSKDAASVELDSECLCPICLDLLYKPVCNSSCGHCFCFWCNHKSMNCFGESHCPYCRTSYSTFPRICSKLHQILSKLYPTQMKAREMEVKLEEESKGISAPLVSIEADQPITIADFKCDGCSEFLYKPLVLTCGHAVCTWCFYAEEEDGSIDVETDTCPVCLLPTCTTLLVPSHLFNHLIHHLDFDVEVEKRKEVFKNKEEKWQEMLKQHQKKQLVAVKEEHKKFAQSPFAAVTDHSSSGDGSYSYAVAPDDSITVTSPSISVPRTGATTAADTMTTTSNPSSTTSNPPPHNVLSFTLDIDKFVHYGVGCDICGVFPIVGRRYKCKDCPEKIGFDLCESCLNMGVGAIKGRFNQSHEANHKMVEEVHHTIIHSLQAMNPQLTTAEILALMRCYYENS